MRQQDRHSLRPSYQLNGLFNHPSLKSLSPSVVPEVTTVCNSLSKQSFMVNIVFILCVNNQNIPENHSIIHT